MRDANVGRASGGGAWRGLRRRRPELGCRGRRRAGPVRGRGRVRASARRRRSPRSPACAKRATRPPTALSTWPVSVAVLVGQPRDDRRDLRDVEPARPVVALARCATTPAAIFDAADIAVNAIGAMALTLMPSSAALERQAAGEPPHGGLGGRVGARPGDAEQTRVRRGRHDPAVALLARSAATRACVTRNVPRRLTATRGPRGRPPCRRTAPIAARRRC